MEQLIIAKTVTTWRTQAWESPKDFGQIGPAAQAAIPDLIKAVKVRRVVLGLGGLFEHKEEINFDHATASA